MTEYRRISAAAAKLERTSPWKDAAMNPCAKPRRKRRRGDQFGGGEIVRTRASMHGAGRKCD